MKTVLITGASSGIGRELAKVYARNGFNLVLVGRRENRLDELKKEILEDINFGILINGLVLDLARSESIQRLVDFLEEKGIQVDVLVNNAGVGIFGKFSDLSNEEFEKNLKLIDVNVKALVELTWIFLRKMKERNEGGILNVASVASFQPGGPLMATYYASKSFVLTFTEGIREEMRDSNVRISTLCPGPTMTEFEKMEEVSGIFNKMKTMSAKKVAEIAYKDFSRGKSVIIPGKLNKIAVFFGKFIPRNLALKIVKKIQEKK